MARDSNYIGGPFESIIVDYAYADYDDSNDTIHYFDTDHNEIGTFHENSENAYLSISEFSDNGSVIETKEYFRETDGSFNYTEASFEKGENDTVVRTEITQHYENDGTEDEVKEIKTFFVCDISIGDVYEMNESEYKEFCESGTIGGFEIKDAELKEQIISIVEDDTIPVEHMETESIDSFDVDSESKQDGSHYEYTFENPDSTIDKVEIDAERKEFDSQDNGDYKETLYDAEDRIVLRESYDAGYGLVTTEVFHYDEDGHIDKKVTYEKLQDVPAGRTEATYEMTEDGRLVEHIEEMGFTFEDADGNYDSDNGEYKVIEFSEDNVYYESETVSPEIREVFDSFDSSDSSDTDNPDNPDGETPEDVGDNLDVDDDDASDADW